MIGYVECTNFQKLVISLISGLAASQDELDRIQTEFRRLDKDQNGTLSRDELEGQTGCKWCQKIDINWDQVIENCDTNGDGVIDYEEFLSACIDRKVLQNSKDIKTAFKILDRNGDGEISIDDFDELYNSNGG
mgnify:CR=1 FL=1